MDSKEVKDVKDVIQQPAQLDFGAGEVAVEGGPVQDSDQSTDALSLSPGLSNHVPYGNVQLIGDEEKGPRPPNTAEDAFPTPTGEGEEQLHQLSRVQLVTLSIAMALSVFLMALDESIIATAIPRITDDFDSLADVGWYGSGYMMTMACFQLTFGKLYKHLSSKAVLLSALLVFEVGSAVCASAPTSAALIVGRVIAGTGSSGIVSGVLIIVSEAVPLRKRAIYTSSVGSIYGVAAACGPLLGGVFTESRLTWRWCFWINLPLGAAVAAVIFFLYHPGPKGGGGSAGAGAEMSSASDWIRVLDPLGLVLFTGAIVCLVLALQISGAKGWGSPEAIGLVAGGFGGLLLAFWAVQLWRGERGTLPPRIARMRRVAAASLYAFFIDSAYYVVAYYLPIWFQAAQRIGARESGIRLLPIICAAVLASLVSGAVVSRTGHYAALIYLSAGIAATGCGLLSRMTPASGAGEWAGFQAMVGVGVGLGMQQAAVVVQDGLDRGDIPTAIAAVTLFQALGSAVMVSVAQNVFASRVYDRLSGIDPSLSREAIIRSGATELVDLAPPGRHDVFLDAVSLALTQSFYVAAGGAAVSALFGLGLGFKRLGQRGGVS